MPSLELIGEGIHSLDADGLIVSENSAALSMFGRESAEMIGRASHALIHHHYADGRDYPSESSPFLQTLRDGQIRKSESEVFFRKDGSSFPVEYTCSPIRNQSGSVTGAVVNFRDITKRKADEAALFENGVALVQLARQLEVEKSRLLAAQTLAKVGDWEIDSVTSEMIWSEEMYRIFELDPVVRPTRDIFLGAIYTDDRGVVEKMLMQTARHPDAGVVEHRLRTGDGQIKYIEERWRTILDPRVKSVRAIGTCQDISERKAAEENLRHSQTLLRMAGGLVRMGAWSVDLPGYILTWSDEVCAIHGVPPGKVPSVKDALEFYAPEFREAITTNLGTCIREGVSFDLELQIITAQGERVWVRAIGEAERDSAGIILRVQGAFQDISDRKRAIEEMRQLAARLTTTLESITDAFLTMDRDWRFTFVNGEAERLLGRSSRQLIGKDFWTEFPTATGSIFERECRDALRDDRTVTFEELFPPLNIWISVRAYPSEQGVAVYFRDITAARLAIDVLRTSEDRFRLLAKSTNDAIWDWNVLTQNLWWSEGYEKLFGYSREEADSTIKSWTDFIHPEDFARVSGSLHHALAENSEVWTDEYRFRCRNGNYAYVLDRGHILRDLQGKPVRMIGGMTDLSARKRSEERLAEQAALINEARDAIAVRDLDHCITFWSKGAERLFGWKAEEVLGRNLVELLHLDFPRFEQADRQVREVGEWHGELRKTAKNGAALIVDARWTLLKDAQGKAKSILSIDTDITERKKLEEQLLRMQRLESVGTLAAGIAHDFNNILAPILMSVGFLKRKIADHESLAALATVQTCAQRGAELVRQVLSFSRGVEGDRLLVYPLHLFRDIQKMITETFPKTISFQLTSNPDLWTLIGDPTQLHQVFMNLCVNARDAMPRGGALSVEMDNVTVDEVVVARNPEAVVGSFVCVRVGDTGMGIPDAVRDRIFEPFFTTKEFGRGTGLGLSTTLTIVKSHGGFIEVKSELNQGTSFSIYLPANDVSVAEVSADPEVVEPVEEFQGHGELILLVDDEEPLRSLGQTILECFGYRVVLAVNGIEAVEIYTKRREEIAAVVTDMAMPVMDGMATIMALKGLNPAVKIIASSGLMSRADDRRAMAAGVLDFVPKPYLASTMLKVIAEVLRQ